ncbi:AAA family ATPase [Fusobacterium sp.]|uniref:ATP-binding protein n=1 Tax=Fusobacterium sp. TaxID=68766 RepID=UPI00260C3BEE|nr:AAA family ATPase [Fusobacterium sp.]
MLKRKLYKTLLEWKNNDKGTTALLIDGARRIGKSYICEEFGKNEYKSYILIDFGNISKEIVDVFENESSNLDLFFMKISAFYGIRLYERESLIIFDEIQQFPRARQFIKYLVKDGRYDYIETGSLLSLKRNTENIILPSEEKHIEMYPLDFEEFLWALGNTVTIPLLKEFFIKKLPLGQALHRKIMNDFRQYILVGGMPQAINKYLETKNFADVDDVKRNILNLYRNDIGKFAKGYENKVISIFDEIPSQLSKKEKKYRLSAITKKARYREYKGSLMWLNDAMITNTCYNSTDPNVGFSLNKDSSTRKCYMMDTGLLVTQTFMDSDYTENDLYKAVLFNKLNINEGMLMENIVAQVLRTNGHRLFFYSKSDNEDRSNNMELDFLVKDKENLKKIAVIEVKSSTYKKHSSLDKFRTKYKERIGTSYILYQKDLMIKDEVVHLPIYMSIFL